MARESVSQKNPTLVKATPKKAQFQFSAPGAHAVFVAEEFKHRSNVLKKLNLRNEQTLTAFAS